MFSPNDTRLTVAIYDLIIYEGLDLNLALKTWFKKLLDLEIIIPKGYNPTNRKIVYNYPLDFIYD